MTLGAVSSGRAFILPLANAAEAALVECAVVYPATSLLAVCAHLTPATLLTPEPHQVTAARAYYPEFSEVKGQAGVKRALEIAAAGGHSVLMSGPLGTGKSMLASRFSGILPDMSETEAIESAALLSPNNDFSIANWRQRPFRAPHHTASAVALWWVAAVTRATVRFHWHIMAFCFKTNSLSSSEQCSMSYVSH